MQDACSRYELFPISQPKCMILTITQTSKSNPVPIQNFPTHFRLPPTSTRDCAGGSSSPARSSTHGRCRKDGELCGVFPRRLHQGEGRRLVVAFRIHRR
jgi:hypothetical protein